MTFFLFPKPGSPLRTRRGPSSSYLAAPRRKVQAWSIPRGVPEGPSRGDLVVAQRCIYTRTTSLSESWIFTYPSRQCYGLVCYCHDPGDLFSSLLTHQHHHELRLDRALQHLRSLETEARRWRQGHPYRVTHEPDPQTSKKRIRVEVLEQPPAAIRLLIGDCVHNLRSALDNLIYELLVARHGDPPPTKFVEYSEFPIFSQPMSAKARKRRIGGIAPVVRTIIEGLQPYNRGQKFASDPLWVLHELSRIDKHRLPLVVLMVPAAFAFFKGEPTGAPVGISKIEWNPRPIEDDAIIAWYEPDPNYPHKEIEVDLTHIFGIGFGQGSPASGWEITMTLKRIYHHIIRKVVPPHRPFLPLP